MLLYKFQPYSIPKFKFKLLNDLFNFFLNFIVPLWHHKFAHEYLWGTWKQVSYAVVFQLQVFISQELIKIIWCCFRFLDANFKYFYLKYESNTSIIDL